MIIVKLEQDEPKYFCGVYILSQYELESFLKNGWKKISEQGKLDHYVKNGMTLRTEYAGSVDDLERTIFCCNRNNIINAL